MGVLEEDFVRREVSLQEKVEDRDRKLVAASRALQRIRGQLRQKTAQLGLKDIQCAKLDVQVTQLQHLLVEKEQRLQETLDDAEHAKQSSATSAAQPQEPPVVPASLPGHDRQLEHLTEATEDLTAALASAADVEAALRGSLATARDELAAETLRAADLQARLDAEAAARGEQERLSAELAVHIAELQQALAADRAQVAELQERAARVQLEEHLHQAYITRGRPQAAFHPHFEV